ncbi:amidohydrolase/deacetylase family metallohydrolase [Pseudoflavitalea sp. X16]|uniref:amidohydrolase/deacetylase family metallohydrolase n=1 Tax=Paraflavitalea devenefica TaxID=2716334 RepID=UPI001423C2DD|nr:amidohydrolase/deacetylase family metallohydrolase [Paraflavitalea devenefica]NII25189.1 amidohydrolase/deacetylase family metallohydrolase [Paraflavitalea devenefica]
MRKTTVLLFLFSIILFVQAQQYAIVIKGGHIIDPRNNINELMDIAINDSKVVAVAKNIDARQAIQVVDAKGMYVTPGLIDIHGHFFYGTDPDNAFSNGTRAIPPDGFTFRAGVTTVVDAGGAGWRNFPLFKKQVIDNSQTRVLSLLNIVGDGMKGILYEQNTHDMDAKMTALVAKRYPEYIVGVKVAHFIGQEWTPVEEAVKAGNAAGIPVMIDFGSSQPQLSIQDLFLKYLRPGDIFTHCFGQLKDREPVVDINNQQVKPFVLEAQRKGVVFDVGYGELSFTFSQAIPAIRNGFYPNSISTDIHSRSMNLAMKDMLHVMSKLMAIGMDLPGVIKASTWNPAKEIKHEELGHLSPGAIADIAILSVREGKFGYYDYTGYKIEAPQKLECEMTIKGGKIVYDLNGIATPVIVINQKK